MRKRAYLLIFLIPFLYGCNEDFQIEDPKWDEQKVQTNRRSIAEAIELSNLLRSEEAGQDSRSFAQTPEVIVLGGNNSRGNNDTLLYVLNYPNDKGYTIVSAAQAGVPILADVPEGKFEQSEKYEGGFALFMDCAKMYAESQLGSSLNFSDSIVLVEPPKVGYSIPNKLGTKWGPCYPEGMYCPNRNAGCTQVSLVQILSYFEEPTQMQLTYDGRDKDLEIIDWAEIKKHIRSCMFGGEEEEQHMACDDEEICSANLEAHKTLARVCRQVGQLNNANYVTNSGTLAYPDDARKNLIKLLPNHYVSEFQKSETYLDLFEDLKSGAIACFKGYATEGGHSWVCDGGTQQKLYKKIILADGRTAWQLVANNITLHFDWNLYGWNNGLFYPGVFDMAEACSYDEDFPDNPWAFNYSSGVRYYTVK